MRAQRSHFSSDEVLSSIPGPWSLQKSRAWRFMFLNVPLEILSLYILPHQRRMGLSFRVLALFSRKASNCFQDLTLQTPPSPSPAQPTTHPGPGSWTKSSECSATLNHTVPTTITAPKPKHRVHLPKTGLGSNNWSLGGSGDNHLRESEAESEICINVKLVFAVKCSTTEVYHHEADVWAWKKPDC